MSSCTFEAGLAQCGVPQLTIPELLLILKVVRHLKRHAEVAGQAADAWSEAACGEIIAVSSLEGLWRWLLLEHHLPPRLISSRGWDN